MPVLLNTAAAAVHLGISLRSFQRALASNDPPPAVRITCGSRRDRLGFHPDDLDGWVDRCRQRRNALVQTDQSDAKAPAASGSAGVTVVKCPHCGDETRQEFMLPEFTCGECGMPFSSAIASEVA
jgi:hypothetical protein